MNRALEAARKALSLPTASAARVSFHGDDALPSAFCVTELAAGSIAAAALAVSEWLAASGTSAPRVDVDRRLASLWFGRSIDPVGWSLPAPWDPIAGDYRTRDGWIRLHTNAPAHRAAALAVLDCAADRDVLVRTVATWAADELEAAVLAAGGCAATMRSSDAWAAHPQGRAVAQEPLIEVTMAPAAKAASSNARSSLASPLNGIKVLDLTRVLAGPVATRFLAGYGADVLRIDPPGWDEPAVVPDVALGKRCARLDLERAEDRSTFEGLLAEADVFVHGFRPDALERLGYSLARRRAIRPDLIDVSLDAYGWSGPWAGRRGFDSLVQMSSGIAAAGMAWKHADRPTPLPVQALDHATGYLMAAAAIAGITRRKVDSTATTARLSLARTAHLLVNMGAQEGTAPAIAEMLGADFSSAREQTAWGPARRLEPPVTIVDAPITWRRAASRLGSSAANWASDT